MTTMAQSAATPVHKPFLKSMNLYSKFAIFIGFIAVAMVFNNPLHLLPFLALALILSLAAGIKLGTLFGTVKATSGIFLFLFIFSAFIYDVEGAVTPMAKHVLYHIWSNDYMTIALTTGGMLSGLNFILKMMIMIFAASLFSKTTTIEEMLFGLNRIGLPYQIGLMLSIALRFIPTLKQEVGQIQQAQKSRGASSRKTRGGKKGSGVQGIIPLFVPMIVSAMRRSDTMAMSMISRGYGYSNKRTQMLTVPFGPRQILFCLLVVAVFAGCIYLKSYYGFGRL